MYKRIGLGIIGAVISALTFTTPAHADDSSQNCWTDSVHGRQVCLTADNGTITVSYEGRFVQGTHGRILNGHYLQVRQPADNRASSSATWQRGEFTNLRANSDARSWSAGDLTGKWIVYDFSVRNWNGTTEVYLPLLVG